MSLVAVITSFPTVVFTVLLGVSLVYWLFVLVGALDLDSQGAAHGAAGAAKGVAHGAGHAHLATHAGAGHAHLASHAAAGHVHLAGHAHAGHVHLATHAGAGHAHLAKGAHAGAAPDAAAHEGVLATLLSFRALRAAPLTIVLTIFAAIGFLLSALSVTALSPEGRVGALVGLGILAAASVVSLLVTSIAVRPIAKVFEVKRARGNADLVGSVVVVTTSRVTESFGQAQLDDHGAGLTLQISADASANLTRGDRCVLVEWDAASGRFAVERMPDLDDADAERAAAAENEAAAEEAADPAGSRRARSG